MIANILDTKIGTTQVFNFFYAVCTNVNQKQIDEVLKINKLRVDVQIINEIVEKNNELRRQPNNDTVRGDA